MGGAERYNYISYFKQEATEDCLMEVSRLNLVGMKYDSDDMEVEYSVDNPNSYTLDRGALADGTKLNIGLESPLPIMAYLLACAKVTTFPVNL